MKQGNIEIFYVFNYKQLKGTTFEKFADEHKSGKVAFEIEEDFDLENFSDYQIEISDLTSETKRPIFPVL